MTIGTLGGARFWSPLGMARGRVADNGLLNALIAYWPGNEAAGNALDAHTNALHLTDVNTVTSNPGLVYALARQYTRVNAERHTRASEALLQVGELDFTLAVWVYLDSKPGQMYIVQKDYPWEYAIDYYNVPDRFRFWFYQNAGNQVTVNANAFGSPPLSTWCLVIGWNDQAAATFNIQVNNGAVNSTAKGGMTCWPGAGTFVIGSVAIGSAAFNGRIGPTAFWKSAAGLGGVLSAAQRTALYNAGAGLPYTGFTL